LLPEAASAAKKKEKVSILFRTSIRYLHRFLSARRNYEINSEYIMYHVRGSLCRPRACVLIKMSFKIFHDLLFFYIEININT